MKLRVRCRRTQRRCRITIRLRHRAKIVARRTVRVAPGARKRVTLRLRNATWQRLALRGSIVLTAVITGSGKAQRVRVRVQAG